MAKQNNWTTIFQVTIPELKAPESFKQGRKKFLDRLSQEIEPLREELGYAPNMSATDKLVWQVENSDRVREQMLEILPKFWLTDEDVLVNLLATIFYEGIDAAPRINGMISPSICDAFPLFFVAVGLPPEINELEPQQREFLTNDLYIEGQIPGLSKESLEQIFKRKGDYVIRGNLALFDATAFREIGKWLGEIKRQIDAGEVFGIKAGRRYGSGHGISQQTDKMALEMYLIHETIKEKSYKGKQRKPRKGRSRWSSISDEVRFEYEGRHRLPVNSISVSTVKRLVRKGKEICVNFKANKGRFNSA